MISLQISTGAKFLTIFIMQIFIGCEDGLTYDENGQVINAPTGGDTVKQAVVTDSISTIDTTVFYTDTAVSIKKEDNRDTAKINTKAVDPDDVVTYAETKLGIPYKYASIDPKVGFDCSGFITHVFNHFNIKVPRSSIDFTHVGRAVPVEQARKGDLILFTGTNKNIRVVGHMGIVISTDNGEIKFIHSSSGKANGVTITPLNGYYQGRFVSIRRIFPDDLAGRR
jgi:hypothetical protein